MRAWHTFLPPSGTGARGWSRRPDTCWGTVSLWRRGRMAGGSWTGTRARGSPSSRRACRTTRSCPNKDVLSVAMHVHCISCGVQNTGALQAIRRLPQGPACGHHERHLIDRPLRIAAGTARSSSSSPRYTCTLRQTSSNICTSHLGTHCSGGSMRCAWHDCSDMTEVFARPASLTADQGVELGRCWRAPQGSTKRTGGGRGRISPTTRSPTDPSAAPASRPRSRRRGRTGRTRRAGPRRPRRRP